VLPASHGGGPAVAPGRARAEAAVRRGFEYSDGWVDDARLVVLNAIDARRARRRAC
jgi:glycerol-3-phosphate dehydrogenase